MNTLIDVPAAQRFDEARLAACLAAHVDGFTSITSVRQFQGGQSNPTYLIETTQRRYVLRRKPPGKLLATAHQIEREYRVQRALAGSGVPVPRMHALCEDTAIIGTAFYLMDHVDGDVPPDLTLGALAPAQRRHAYEAMIDTLARLHTLDVDALGLGDLGRRGDYVRRQIARWWGQYDASRAVVVPDLDALHAWLLEHLPTDDASTLVHGDYRPGNMLLTRDDARIAAVLDWELATIGHPLSDVAYFCAAWYLPAGTLQFDGLEGRDLTALGIPTVDDLLARYCAATGRERIADWHFYVAYSMFRLAAICEGVYARALAGNAADARAREFGAVAPMLGATGLAATRRAGT